MVHHGETVGVRTLTYPPDGMLRDGRQGEESARLPLQPRLPGQMQAVIGFQVEPEAGVDPEDLFKLKGRALGEPLLAGDNLAELLLRPSHPLGQISLGPATGGQLLPDGPAGWRYAGRFKLLFHGSSLLVVLADFQDDQAIIDSRIDQPVLPAQPDGKLAFPSACELFQIESPDLSQLPLIAGSFDDAHDLKEIINHRPGIFMSFSFVCIKLFKSHGFEPELHLLPFEIYFTLKVKSRTRRLPVWGVGEICRMVHHGETVGVRTLTYPPDGMYTGWATGRACIGSRPLPGAGLRAYGYERSVTIRTGMGFAIYALTRGA